MITQTESYPRPRLRRSSFFSLDGDWHFGISKEEFPLAVLDQIIKVPFPPEAKLSGISYTPSKEDYLHYRKIFSLPSGFTGDDGEVLLHFGAVNSQADVFLNDTYLGTHIGGHLPFSFQIKHLLKQENILAVRVPAPKENCQSECENNHSLYSGIWQSVYLEYVPSRGIYGISVESTDKEATITVKSHSKSLIIQYYEDDEEITRPFSKEITIRPKNPKLWSPEEPYLYRFTVFSPDDRAESYFALRCAEVRVTPSREVLFLNGQPYFLHGVEHNSLYLKDREDYEKDILRIKALGFNTVYKHYPDSPNFYEACDRLGLIVLQDTVLNNSCAHLDKTVSPNFWFNVHPNETLSEQKNEETLLHYMHAAIEHLAFYPSLLLFNVSHHQWKKDKTEAFYEKYKLLYPNILFSVNGGTFARKTSILSDYVLYRKANARYKRERRAFILSSLRVRPPMFTGGRAIQGNLKPRYSERFYTLYQRQILSSVRAGACGSICVQFADGVFSYKKYSGAQKELSTGECEKLQELSSVLRKSYGDICNSHL